MLNYLKNIFNFNSENPQFKRVFDDLPEIVFQVNNDKIITWGNKAFFKRVPDAIGQPCNFLCASYGSTIVDCYCSKAIESGKIEKTIIYKPGISPLYGDDWWDAKAIPLKNNKDSIIGALSILKNINEFKKDLPFKDLIDSKSIKGEVKQIVIPENFNVGKFYEDSEETLNALIVSSPAAIVILDNSGLIKIWNPAAELMFDWKSAEVIGKQIYFLSPNADKEIRDLITQSIHGKINSNIEIILLKKDDTPLDVSLSVSPLKNSSGEIIGIMSIILDISKRRKAEESMRESEIRYHSFIQNFKGIAYRVDTNMKPLFFNGAVKEITGYEEEEFTGGAIQWRDIIHPDDLHVLQQYDDEIGKERYFEHDFEYRIIKKNKQICWIHEHLQNTPDTSGKVIYVQGTMIVVTERKEAEEELKRSREHLRNLALHLESTREEEKKHIAFEIHDELGHALTALKLELNWLVKKKFLRPDVLYEKVRKMSDLIDSTIRKVRSISAQLRPSVLDHFGLAAAIEWQTAEFQKRTAVRCKLNMPQTDIRVDEARSIAVFRIYQEILTNIARHAMATRVDVTLERINNRLLMRVSDNGRGIKQEQIHNKKSFGMLGMLERANALGGKLTITGVIGIGTTVTIDIPLTN